MTDSLLEVFVFFMNFPEISPVNHNSLNIVFGNVYVHVTNYAIVPNKRNDKIIFTLNRTSTS